MKIKVLFFVSTLEQGGPSNIIYNIIKYLDRKIIEPSILTLSPEPSKTKKKEFEDLGVQIFSFHKSRLWWMLSKMDELKMLVSKISPDIIHSHSLRPDASSAKHFKSYIQITTIHGILHTNYTHTYGWLIGSYFARKQMNSIQKLDYAVACSQSIYDSYKNRIRQISVIQNGVDEDFFYPITSNQKIQKRKELGLPIEKKIIITVGSLTKLKDPETIAEAFEKCKYIDDAILLIVGTGELERKLKRKYCNRNNIIFKGFINNVAAHMQCADLYISASTSEGLPNSVIEALGCGLPVCLSDIPPHQEILSIHKEAGEIFPCRNSSQLTAAIEKNFVKPEVSGEYANRIVKERLNGRFMSLSYQKLYVSLHKNL